MANPFIESAVGMGFRPEIYRAILQHLHELDTLEVMVDHYISGSPQLRQIILDISQQIPIVSHGVGLSLGTAVLPDKVYLGQVSEAIESFGSPWHSEHLAFTKVPGRDLAQLLPLPRTRKVAEIVIENLEFIQKHLSVPLLIENITYYFEYPESDLSELEFVKYICQESGVHLLLDVENLYINSVNHNYDPYRFIDELPRGLIKGVHIVGGREYNNVLLDSHDQAIPAPALELLAYLLKNHKPQTVILERDGNLNKIDEIFADIKKIKNVIELSKKKMAVL